MIGVDAAAQAAASVPEIATPVGVIDGAPSTAEAVAATRGLVKGAPLASNHGSAVVSLLQRAGVRRVLAADVFGSDPADGGALAIVRKRNGTDISLCRAHPAGLIRYLPFRLHLLLLARPLAGMGIEGRPSG